MKTDEIYDWLKTACANAPYLVHAKNIAGKHASKDNAHKHGVLDLFAEKYMIYLTGNLALRGSSRETVAKRVKLLNDYYDFFSDYDATHEKKN